MTNRTGKQKQRLAARREDYQTIPVGKRSGTRMPGSMNPHKSHSLGRQKKRLG